MKDIKIFVVLSVLAVILGIPAGRVSAAPKFLCSGSSCNNVDPQGSGCSAVSANSAWKTGSNGSGILRVDLRWSSGCNSNWSRATNEYPYAIRKLRAQLTDSSPAYNNLVTPYASSAYAQIWTNMYNGTPYNCAKGQQGPLGGSYDASIDPPACG